MNVEKTIPEEFARGQRDAEKDITTGAMRYFTQPRGGWADYFISELKTRFGAEVQETTCFINSREDAYYKGYNSTIEAHVDKTLGEGSFQKFLDGVREFRVKLYAGDSSETQGS